MQRTVKTQIHQHKNIPATLARAYEVLRGLDDYRTHMPFHLATDAKSSQLVGADADPGSPPSWAIDDGVDIEPRGAVRDYTLSTMDIEPIHHLWRGALEGYNDIVKVYERVRACVLFSIMR